MSQPQKILIVDDKRENLFALRSVLQELDVVIIEADNGNDALAATLEHRFSLAILDVMMPEINGYELAMFLKSDPSTAHMPIIFVTAVYSEEDRIFKGYESGAVDYIVKPYNPAVLVSKVNVFLALDRARNELSEKIQELTASEERFRTLVATIPDIIYRIDSNGRFTYLNDAIKTLGYDPKELLGAHFSKIIHPDDIGKISRRQVLPQYIGSDVYPEFPPKLFDERRTGERITKDLEVRLLTKKGGNSMVAEIHSSAIEVLIGEINSSGLYQHDTQAGRTNSFLGSVGVIRDINQRKLVEKELQEYRRGLEIMVRERTAELQEEITERKRAQIALAERERYFRGMMHGLYEYLVVIDKQFFITDINDSYLAALGKHSREEVVGRPCQEIFSKFPSFCIKDCANCYLRNVFESGQPHTSLHEFIDDFGLPAHVEISLSPLRDMSKEVTSVVAAIHDVTEIVTARKAAENAHRKLSMAIKAVKIFFWDWDIPNNKMIFSTEWKTQLGYGKEDDFDETLNYQELLHEDDKAVTLKKLQDLANGDSEDFVAQFRLRHKDGSYRWMYSRAQSIRDESNKVQSVTGCNIDISEKKAEEDRRDMLQKQLIESQKMESIGRLAGGIAHDFNNLLTIILSYTTLILEDLPAYSTFKDDLEEIRLAGERAAGLTRQLLAFSRKQVFEPVLLELNQVVSNVEKMLRRILGEDINFVKELAPDLGLVLADPGQIEQVLLNMAVNARDAMPEGGKLTIETENVELDEEYVSRHINVEPGSYVMIAITDSGIGMDAVTKASIFDPFFTTKPKGRGTGLGLSTVYGIIKQSGGDIWVYSELGKGTTFKIYLPLKHGDKPWQVQKLAAHLPATGSETILLAEDDASVRKITESLLSRFGYNILSVGSGREALQTAHEYTGEIDLVLTDVVMPEMSGSVMVGEITKIRPDVKILYMSGYTDNAIVHHGVLDAGTSFIGKPFSIENLLAKVREVLDHGASPSGSGRKPSSWVSTARDEASPVEKPDEDVLVKLPEDVKIELQAAARAAYYDQLDDIVKRISSEYPEAANLLDQLLMDFEYEKILEWLD